MAYQKLQVGTGIAVVPSDTIDIPAVSGPVVDSTMSQVPPTTSTVVDSTQDFTAIQGLVGSPIVIGTSIARVATVASATSITLDAAIAGTAAVGYKIYVKDSNPGCVLYPGWFFRSCSGQACFQHGHHGYGHPSPVVICPFKLL
jgi:hypothetical protein